MNRQETIGRWIMAIGKMLLVVVAIACAVDILGLSSRGHLLFSLSTYLTAIFTGVGMQFVGAAIPNMRFTANS